jgi:pimeloyl-ACP methyl ester carboxylesterase
MVRRVAVRLLITIAAGVCAIVIRPAFTPSIPGESSIASLERVRLGGFEQTILIRGADRNAPVLLFLHGGPGMPAMFLEHSFGRPLEKDFVVVHWDRLGAGKSFRTDIPPSAMRVTREWSDTLELMDRLRARFRQDRIFLVGHSYGSSLGMLVASRSPERIIAYVGAGQVAGGPAREHEIQDRWLRSQAQAKKNDELLAKIGTRGFDRERWLFHYGGELAHETSLWPILRTGLTAPEYSFRDAFNVKRGVQFTHKHMRYDALSGDLMDAVQVVRVPVFFFVGRRDYTAPFELTQEYFTRLDAPHKELVWFEESAHFPFFEEPERFAAEMGRVKSLMARNHPR